MKIVIIGTGNVATVLGRMLLHAGYTMLQVYGRSAEHAAALARELGCSYCSSWQDIVHADMYLLAISDHALYDLHQHFKVTGEVVLHTAGSVSKEVLKSVSANYGVLYPLQSLRKNVRLLTEIPFLVEGNNEHTSNIIRQITTRLKSRVFFVSEEERLRLHVAAVCINNFCNHLYALTADFCEEEHIAFDLLLPLAMETAGRIKLVTPKSAQTGPAIRNDHLTIQKHLQLLNNHPLLRALYGEITANITAFYKINDP